MADLPPLPPGFTLDQPVAGPAPIGRPVIRKAPEPKEQKTSYSTLGADEVKRLGLPPGSYQRSSEGKIDRIAEPPKVDPAAKTDPQQAAIDIRNVIDSAFRAKELSRNGWFATGFGAGLAQKAGGTPAADVKGLLDTIAGNTAFATLQKMRDASPTGGALGAISERELDLLKSTVASLDQSQSDEQFQGAMQRVAESYGRVLAKIPGGRAMMIERGWLPKSSKAQPKPKQQAKPRVVDFNDLPE